MHKPSSSHSGIFNLRALAAIAFCALGGSLGYLSFASTPSSGTLTDTITVAEYDAGPMVVANQSPLGLGQLDSGPRCDSTFPCDSYTLNVNLPPGFVAQNNCAAVKVTMSWTDTGAAAGQKSDYDLYIFEGANPTVDGSHPAPYSSASGANPEVAVISPLHDGSAIYTVKIVPYQPGAETVHVRMQLLTGSGCGGVPNFGGPDPTAPGVPRYHVFETPAGSNGEATQGEMNIGYNPNTGRILTMNSGPIMRFTPPERLSPAQPECCTGLWEDVTNPTTITGLDPILWGDQWTDVDPITNQQTTGARMFASNSTAGTNGVYGFTDNDGDTWLPLSASPPNASSDHETIGSGPYPSSLSALGTVVNHHHAVYYCAQTFPTGAAACQRSDTYGDNYGPSVLIYNPNPPTNSQCVGIHGHMHVAPDGTAYVPARDCGSNAGLIVSTDGGVSWTERIVPNTTIQTHGSDPSVAIDSNNKVYFFYVRGTPPNQNEGHIFVQTSTDRGQTWSGETDLGATHGIVNAVFPEAVAGDSGRAACAFLGTDKPGFYEGITFPGFWYAYIATTFDGGASWSVVNATPNDPVQGLGGIWQGGGSNPNRNLLDFNEITMDEKGRVLFGYDDGCVNDCVGDPTKNSFGARIRIARQTGGKTLRAAYDSVTDTTAAKLPKQSCLSGTRDVLASHLNWVVPDNGGADIQKYEIWRGTAPGAETKIGETNGPKPSYNDTTTDPNVAHYYYTVKAVNSVGTGIASNEIDLVAVPVPPAESVCVAPGVTKLADPAGDTSVTVINLTSTPAPPGSDLLSLQLQQPYVTSGAQKLVFTLNTDPGQPNQPVGSSWYVAMKIAGPDPAVSGDASQFHYRGVHMTFKTVGTPTFESYTPSPSNGGVVDGRFVQAGSTKPLEPESSYAAPYNKVVMVVKLSDLGLKPGDSIDGFVSGVSQTSNPVGTGPAATALYDQMPDSLAFAGSYNVGFNSICAPTSPGVVSRMMHGAAGPFDLQLPSSGTVAIEPRNNSNNTYTLVYTFGSNLSFAGGANVTQGVATVASTVIGPNLNQVTVTLTDVANAQHLVVSLAAAKDAAHNVLPSVTAPINILVGDTTADSNVNSADITDVKSQSGSLVTGSNFRDDLNADGNINSADISLVKSQSGTGLTAGSSSSPGSTPAPTSPTKPSPRSRTTRTTTGK